MRRPARNALIAIAGLTLAACGGGGEPNPAPDRADRAKRETAAPAALPAGSADGCAAQGRAVVIDPLGVGPGRRRIDAVAVRARRSGHRFEQLLELRAAGLRATARIEGRRIPSGASAATLTWNGAARILLADLQLRIVDDQLYLLRDDRPGWRTVGSASGIALDVGRELLDHPFLLEPVAARAGGAHVSLDLTAPAPRLRQYATTERRGPVTDLLRGTRRLTLTAHAAGRRLVGDDFLLVTRIPPSLDLPALRPGTMLTVSAESFYCPLRAADRLAISAPKVRD